MNCKACTNVSIHGENEDCFENALDVLKKHYVCKYFDVHMYVCM